MHFLNSKERKHFFATLETLYGYHGSTDYVLMTPGNGKYYLLSRGIDNIDYEALRVTQAGLYVASDAKDGLRLSMDGAILFGPECAHKPVQLNEEERNQWMRGDDVPAKGREGWVIVRDEDDILGCGKVRDDTVINFVPKERRIQDPH